MMVVQVAPMTKQQIIESAKKLPREDQVDLAMEFWEIVGPTDEELPLTDELKAELDRRIEAFERNPSDARPWEEVREEILREFNEKK